MKSDFDAQEISDWTSDLLALSDVKRWAIVHTIRTQSVAEHSFRVGVIAMSMCERLELPDPKHSFNFGQLLAWAMMHDAPEGMTGDIDGKFKRDNPDIKAMMVKAEELAFPWVYSPNDEVKWIVKVADYIETATFIQRNGTGPVADDIYHELEANLFDKALPQMIRVLGLEYNPTEKIIRNVMYESASESNHRQLRRHRRPNAGSDGGGSSAATVRVAGPTT